MEFKVTQRAEEYVNNAFFDSGENKNIDKCFKNFAKGGFLDGYNQALEDTKSKEMLEMLEMHIYALDNGMLDFYKKYGFNISELSGKVRELIKQKI